MAGLWERVVFPEADGRTASPDGSSHVRQASNRSTALERYELRAALARSSLEAPTQRNSGALPSGRPRALAASPIGYVEARASASRTRSRACRPADDPKAGSPPRLDWEEPYWVRWCERMTAFARLIRFDKRGTGLSDRPPGASRSRNGWRTRPRCSTPRRQAAPVLGWSEGGQARDAARSTPSRARPRRSSSTGRSCPLFAASRTLPWEPGRGAQCRPSRSSRSGSELALGSVFRSTGQARRSAQRWAAYQRARAQARRQQRI